MSAEVTYETRILIGVQENGVMTVIADWPQVPKQSEVQDRITPAMATDLRAVYADVDYGC
jgi:hypothetical protein